MVITYDKTGRVISRCKNLRYALERVRRVPVAYIAVVGRPGDGADVQISWHDGAYMLTDFASFEVAKTLFEDKARNDPRRWPKPVFNY